MRLDKALKEKQMDVRVRDRYVIEGILKEEDVEKYLHSLEDDSKNCIEVTSGFSSAERVPSLEEETSAHVLLDNEG